MVRASRAAASASVARRLAAPLSIALMLGVLMLTSLAVGTPAVAAGGTGSEVAAVRARELAAEAAMRRADKQIARLQHARRHHAKGLATAKQRLDHAIARRNKVRTKAGDAEARLTLLRQTLARAVLVHPDPRGIQAVDKPELRAHIRKLDKRVGRLDARLKDAERRVDKARDLVKSRRSKPSLARIAARKVERERAESLLSAAIGRMLELSSARAGAFAPSTVNAFAKPLKGHLSQPFGCTGFKANPPSHACHHFHDGVDLAAPKGTRVKAAADGYVAYVGYSPWDQGKRAYIVIIAHRSGYRTVYAHLQPRRMVSPGQRVRRGQTIGVVGMTGTTTGPHVHWEVRLGDRALNPLKAGG